MRLRDLVLALLVFGGSAASLAAQQTDTTARRQPLGARLGDARTPSRAAGMSGGAPGTPHYDVVLEVPELSVDSIGLEVDDLRAHLALDAQVASLVMLTAGVDVGIERVNLRIEGVLAEVYLYVDLDNVAHIVDRALTTLENNPEILQQLLATIDTAVGVVGQVGGAALQPGGVVDQTVGVVGRTLENVTAPGGVLSQTVNAAGQTLQTTLTTTGSIVEHTLDASGRVLNARTLGSITRLPLVRETTNAAGATVRQVRDTAGNVIEYVLGAGGAVSGVRVVERARP
jgi:hypothetical protein